MCIAFDTGIRDSEHDGNRWRVPMKTIYPDYNARTPSSLLTLSGCVPNGHQAMHFVSSALSKIPYGGFSSVRL